MKTFVLIRHAKSSWDDASLSDHDRPLNKRGKRDAPMMAKMLAETSLKPDLIVSSTANRAWTTAKHFAAAFGIEEEAIDARRDLYMAWYEDLELAIRSLPDEANTVFLFNHNPSSEHLAALYSDYAIDRFPTCAIAHFESDIDTWDHFFPKKAKLVAHYYPKQFK